MLRQNLNPLKGPKDMIQFESANRSVVGEVPTSEIKLKEREMALEIRKEYKKLRKDGKMEGRDL